MGLSFKYVEDQGTASEVVATARLCLTDNDTLVPENHIDARRLFCTPGDAIPRAVAERYGLLSDDEPEGDDSDEGKPERPTVKVVRAWAEEQGIDVPKRGKFPEDVIEQYITAHANDEE